MTHYLDRLWEFIDKPLGTFTVSDVAIILLFVLIGYFLLTLALRRGSR